MTTERSVEEWREAGTLRADQAAALLSIVRKERFSVSLELNSLLYLGVVVFAAGLGWTVREHFASLGDAAVLLSLAVIFAGCLFYCFARATRYSPERVESPTFAFDYVLYLACLTFAVGVAYIEYRFHLLAADWDYYLLASAVLYFALAYRFDNRFVLALALSTLAAWFGVRLSIWTVFSGSIRALGLLYGVLVSSAGLVMRQRDIKAHFLDTYLHVGVNAVLLSLTSGTIDYGVSVWLVGLVPAAAACIALGARHRRFAFLAYGVVYAYVGLSSRIVRELSGDTQVLSYFLLSGAAVVIALIVVATRFGREP